MTDDKLVIFIDKLAFALLPKMLSQLAFICSKSTAETVEQDNRLSTTKGFTQYFKERYHHKREGSQGSNPKNYLPEEGLKEKLYKDKSLSQSLIFLKELLRLQKLHFPLKDCMDGYF